MTLKAIKNQCGRLS